MATAMLNRALRYLTVIDIISSYESGSLLEVGSGAEGIGEFWDKRFTGCDVHFPTRINRRLSPVVCSAVSLPFRSGIFDTVLATDLLEHIEPEGRHKVVDEALRVSRGMVIVAFPCGHHAVRSEKYLLKWYRLIGRTPPPWLLEHVGRGLPAFDDIKKELESHADQLTVFNNENAYAHLFVMLLESLPFICVILNKFQARYPGLVRRFLKISNFNPSYRKIIVIKK